MGQAWARRGEIMVNAAGRAALALGAAERVGIDQQQRFDAGIELGDAGIGDVVEGDAEARLAGEAIGEFDAGLELDRVAEVEASAVAPIPGCRVAGQHDTVAERQLDADAGVAEEGAARGAEGADQRLDDPQQGLGEAIFKAELGLGVAMQHVIGASAAVGLPAGTLIALWRPRASWLFRVLPAHRMRRSFSVAPTRRPRMPGSIAECPASGTTRYSASGQARASSSALTIGQTMS